MNKYQKKKSREIKAIMRHHNRLEWVNYKVAKKAWRWGKRFQWCSPCEDCDNGYCRKVGKPIVYCPERR